MGVPALDFREAVLGRAVKPTFLEDGAATIATVRGGRFLKFRHTQRAHGVNTRWPFDCLQRKIYALEDCHTERMPADILTEAFPSNAVRLLGYRDKAFDTVVVRQHIAPIVSASVYLPVNYPCVLSHNFPDTPVQVSGCLIQMRLLKAGIVVDHDGAQLCMKACWQVLKLQSSLAPPMNPLFQLVSLIPAVRSASASQRYRVPA